MTGIRLAAAVSIIAASAACTGGVDEHDGCVQELLREQRRASTRMVEALDRALPRMEERYARAIRGRVTVGDGFFKETNRLERLAERLEDALDTACQ